MTQLLNAADFGVPQRRERVFFVGFREDLGISWSFPQPTHSREALSFEKASGSYWERAKVAHKDRPPAETGFCGIPSGKEPRELPWMTVHEAISSLPEPGGEAGMPLHNHRFQPGARSYPGHTGSPLHEPAKTLKAGVHGVPGGENMLRRPDGSVRYFTVRESARLQTFPDDYVFHGSWGETMRQLGNAVPVKLASVVGESVAKYLRNAA